MIYKIECKNCDRAYIGETGRKFDTRLSEHMKYCEQDGKKVFTRTEEQQSLIEMNKSAITDHINSTNDVIDWEGAKIRRVIRKPDRSRRRYTPEFRERSSIEMRWCTVYRGSMILCLSRSLGSFYHGPGEWRKVPKTSDRCQNVISSEADNSDCRNVNKLE